MKPAMPVGMDAKSVRDRWPLALDSLPSGVDRLSNYDGDLWAMRGGEEGVWLEEDAKWSPFVETAQGGRR